VVTIVRKAVKAMALAPGLVAHRRPGDLVMLLYHRVGGGRAEIAMRADRFERQIAHLSDGNRGGVVITFDDGYWDFHQAALPVLVRHRVPAVLYLATGMVTGEFPGGRDALTWSQVREAVATGLVTVGSHTHTHRDLSGLGDGECEEEMKRSKELIEDRLGMACRHFAYPFAIGSLEADRVARRLFESAAVDAWRTNRRGRIDPHRLGRTPVLRSDGWRFFRAKVAGMLDGEALAYRALGRGPWRRP
jgi:peptidoglycan/xylan/chitin deacetylase (PgdA/CDA1 family)